MEVERGINMEKEICILPNQVDEHGIFLCPKCKTELSPDDYDETAYTMLEPIMAKNELGALLTQCNNCSSKIKIMVQEALIDEAVNQAYAIYEETSD